MMGWGSSKDFFSFSRRRRRRRLGTTAYINIIYIKGRSRTERGGICLAQLVPAAAFFSYYMGPGACCCCRAEYRKKKKKKTLEWKIKKKSKRAERKNHNNNKNRRLRCDVVVGEEWMTKPFWWCDGEWDAMAPIKKKSLYAAPHTARSLIKTSVLINSLCSHCVYILRNIFISPITLFASLHIQLKQFFLKIECLTFYISVASLAN